MKLCSKCGVNERVHYHSWCKACIREDARRRRGLTGTGKERKKPPTLRPGFRWCTCCERALALDQFTRSAKGRGGLDCYCKTCKRSLCRAWKDANRRKWLAYQRAYYRRTREAQVNKMKLRRLKRAKEYHA